MRTCAGYQLMIAGEVFRGRYRNELREAASRWFPARSRGYEIKLRDRNHTFKAGHRIMVQIQSSLFPVIDRNPQRYVPSIYEAVQSDFHPATQSIFRSAQYPLAHQPAGQLTDRSSRCPRAFLSSAPARRCRWFSADSSPSG